MSIKSDYLMDMIARFCEAVLHGIEARRVGEVQTALEDFEGVVGSVLDMDASCALALSSASLVAMMQLSAVDETLVVYCVYALNQAAGLYDGDRPELAELRREQADALACAYGFDPDVTPREVQEALSARAER